MSLMDCSSHKRDINTIENVWNERYYNVWSLNIYLLSLDLFRVNDIIMFGYLFYIYYDWKRME